jgi:hypothetical protein
MARPFKHAKIRVYWRRKQVALDVQAIVSGLPRRIGVSSARSAERRLTSNAAGTRRGVEPERSSNIEARRYQTNGANR